MACFGFTAMFGCGSLTGHSLGGSSISPAVATTPLTASATVVSFGDVTIGNVAKASVSLTNAATTPLQITNLGTTGSGFSTTGATLPVTIAAGGTYTVALQFAPASIGSAAGELTVGSGTAGVSAQVNLSGTGTGSYAFSYADSPLASTVEPQAASPISNNFFGMTIFGLANAGTTTTNLTPFPSFGISALRLWDVTYWALLEPQAGVYSWTKMDRTISVAQEHGVQDFVFTFGHIPLWASTKPAASCYEGPGACAPPNLDAMDEFATQLVRRYCGKVKYYETWNEPNTPNGFWDGSPDQLLTVAQHLYQIVKDPANCGCSTAGCGPGGGTNPNQVLLPSINQLNTSSIQWMDTYLGEAGAQYPYADIATFHGYDSTSPEHDAAEIPALESVLARHGLSSLPIWDTEASWGELTTPVTQAQASWLMREHVLHAAAGISRFIWYAYDGCDWGGLSYAARCGTDDSTGEPNAAGAAYSVVQQWLAGSSVKECNSYKNGFWFCEIAQPNGRDAWMLWSTGGSSIPVSFESGSGFTSYLDWQNNSHELPAQLAVGEMPVLVE